MVVNFTIVHPKGSNVASKYWPHQGHLGLTPLVLSGIVRARRESEPKAHSTPSSAAPLSSPPATTSTTSSTTLAALAVQSQASSSSYSSAASTSSSSASSSSASSSSYPSSAPTSVSSSSSLSATPSNTQQQSLSKDKQPLRASQVVVSLRCYEAKVGRVGVVRTNVLYDHTLTLWSASSNTTTSGVSELARGRGAAQAQAYPSPPPSPTELPQTDFPFHIVIPPRAAGGCSTVKLQSYRVYWRLEASIEGLQAPGYPAGSVLSKNYEVAITRYDDPSSSVSAATSPSPSASSPSPSPSFPLPTPVPSPPITASSSSNATPPPSHEAYTTSTVQIPNHPHILALTAYRPSRGLVANETFGVSFAVTMRQPSGPGAQKTVTVPTKLALSVKRIVEVYDEEQQQPPLDEKGKGKGRAPPLSSSSPSVLTPTSTPPLPVPVPSHLAASPSPSASPPTTNASRFGIMIKQRASNAFGSMGIQRKQHRRREGGKNVSPIVSENERGQTSSISEEEGIGGQPSSFHSTSGMEVDGDGEGDAEADGVAAAANMGGGMFSLFERRRPWRGTSPSPSPSPAASRVRQEDVDFAALSPSPQSSATPTPTLPSPTSSSVHKTVLATESGLFVPITAAPDASLSLSRTATMASSATNLTITTTSSSSDRTIMPAMMPYSPSSWSLPPSYSSLTFPDSQSTSSLSPLLQQAVSTSALSGSEENTALYGTSISLNIPSQRSGGHWGLGESMKTKMVSIKFLLSCKITMTTTTLSSPSSSPTQFTSFGNTTGAPASSMASTVITETIKVAPIEFTISAITPSDRAKIISDYDLAVKKARQQQREKEKEKKARHNSHTPTPQLASASATRDAHLPVPVPTRGRSLSPSAHHRHHPTTTKNERVPPASPRSDSSEGSQSRTVRADSATTTEALVPMQTSPTAESFVDISSSTGLPSAHNGPSGSAGGKLSFFTRRSPTPAPVLTSGAGGISSTLGLPAPTSSAQPVRPQPLRRPSTAGSITSASRRTESDAMAIDEMPKDMWSSPSLNVRRSSARATATRTSSSSGPKPTQLVRRPKTSNGVVTVPGSTNATASPANPAAPPTGSGIGLRRRRSLSPPLPPSARSSSSSRRLPPPSASGVGGSASPAAAFGVAVSAKSSSTIQVDVIGHDTVRAWEEELDRIAARSKRRSIQASPRASMASGAGRVGGTARS